MLISLLISLCLALCAASSLDQDDPSRQDGGKLAVLGYMPEYRLNSGYNYEEAFAAGLTHVIFFSLEVDPQKHVPTALDRMPSKEVLQQARAAADKHGGKLLICFGGNARTAGFPTMVLTKKSRGKFLKALDKLLRENQLDGVDYNWEYPTNEPEWVGLADLIKESRQGLLGGKVLVTMSFYPDRQQFGIIKHLQLHEHCDYIMSMSYDMRGKHSTYEFAVQGIEAWKAQALPWDRMALGVPFYSRNIKTGHADTYSDLLPKLRKAFPDQAQRDAVDELDGTYFNGRDMLKKKVQLALDQRIGGIMIWELGQDVIPTSDPSSLLSAIGQALPGAERPTNGGPGTAKEEL